MPLRRRVSKLQDVCLYSIAENIIYHGRNLELSHNDEVLTAYALIRRQFSFSVLKNLYNIFRKGHNRHKKDFYEVMGCLFLGSTISNLADFSACCRLLFPEDMAECFLECFSKNPVSRISSKVTSHILSNCKDLRILKLIRCTIEEPVFLSAMKKWHHLTAAELRDSTCTDLMVTQILLSCPVLKHLDLSNTPVSDLSMSSFCRNQDKQVFLFCKDKGACRKPSTKLETLIISGTAVRTVGLMFALQHFSSLKTVCDWSGKFNLGDLPKALLTMKRLYTQFGELVMPFKLSEIVFQKQYSAEEIRQVLLMCPGVNCVTFCGTRRNLEVFASKSFQTVNHFHLMIPDTTILISSVWQDFITSIGPRVKCLRMVLENGTVELQCINDVLRTCCNLTAFGLYNATVCSPDFVNDELDFPTCLGGLRKLCFCRLRCQDESSVRLLTQILLRATNLRYLGVSKNTAERELNLVLEKNNFHDLHEISIYDADLTKVSLEQLMKTENKLKIINIYNCTEERSFIRIQKKIAKENNLSLEIVTYQE